MKRHALVLISLIAFSGVELYAQDQFGSDVALIDGQVVVLKPSAGRGPSGIFVYESGPDGWEVNDRLHPEPSLTLGAGLSPSLTVQGNTVFAGALDPDVLWGGHIFVYDGAEWRRSASPMIGEPAEEVADVRLDMQTLIAIMQPPRRSVALNGDFAAVAVSGGGRAELHIFGQAEEVWRRVATVEPEEFAAADQFGSAIRFMDGDVLVGVPGRDSGAVAVYGAEPEGWVLQTVLRASGVSRFGAELAVIGDHLIVGAPGGGSHEGSVVIFRRNSDSWEETARIVSPDSSSESGFGSALAVNADGTELWVGAPAARSSMGAVHVYQRGDGWELAYTQRPPEMLGRARYGSAIALSDDLAAVGAPQAYGAVGRVAVMEREGDSWSEPSWIDPGGNFEMVAGEQIRCEDGSAAQFECSNVDLLAFLPVDALGGGTGERVSDLWGWTDPETGREYALVGRTGGPVIVDITDPIEPRVLGTIPANPSGARDLKVYRDHLFFTGDGAQDHGLQVFDLTRLRDVTDIPVEFEPDAVYDRIHSAHNLVIDTQSGFAFPVGASGGGETCGGGLHMVDIRDPSNPTFAGCYTDTEGLIWQGRTHDAQCLVYDGPDDDYRGRQICFASNESALRIVDITEKDNPEPLAVARYPGLGYVHQGWITDDHRYFFLDDEADELTGMTDRTRTMVWDIEDLDDPILVAEYFGPNRSTDHNLYIKGDRMYQANYQAGLRVVDISDPLNPVEVGFFDTTPYGADPPGFAGGAWTAYPFFESGTVIVSSMNEGLFVLRPRGPDLVP